MKIRNPRTGEDDYEITPLDGEALAACAAQMRERQIAWAEYSPSQRCKILLKFADAIEQHRGAIADALIRDTGRATISQIEIDGVIGMIKRCEGSAPFLIARAAGKDRLTSVPNISTSTDLVPYRLVGVISPWNFPLTLALIDTISALAAGCGVIVKPSELAPRFIRPLMAAVNEVSELPLAIIEGDGATGAALIPLIDYIAFTGSVKTGRAVGMAAAQAFIPASLELGGKDPMIILACANPAAAAEIALRASVVNNGHACQSIERVYVARAIAEPFLITLAEKAKAVRFNYPDINSGDIGPFISTVQADIVQAQIDDARARGALVLTGGHVETLGGGRYLRPTVLASVTPEMDVIANETFGPVIPVTIFDDEDEAVAMANEGIFGLSAAVIAGTAQAAEAVGARLNVGAVSINDGSLTTMVWEAEKSSFGLSGLGPSRMGESGLLRFFRKRAIIRQSGKPLPLSAYAEDALRGQA
jgi:succinate-semialdehyde dehydrogenase / glutarate-semialdehyde dehydrogenase